MRHQGTITEWQDEKGYGFITPDNGAARVFVHIKAIGTGGPRPEVGDILTYELAKDPRGRIRAERIFRPTAHRVSTSAGYWKQEAGTVLAWGIVIVLVGATLLGRLPVVIPALYGVASLLAFAAYGKDKWAAKTGRWRTSESTLLLLGLLGGWPGALTAQRVFRHKSSKRPFQIAFWFTVFLNSAFLCLLLSPMGQTMLHQ